MVFSSIVFLLYFLPLFLATYYFVAKKYKNVIILFFSFIFYAWGAPKFIFVILITTFVDYHLVNLIDRIKEKFYRRLLLILSVSINFGLLFYFKYSNFFIQNINEGLSLFGASNIPLLNLVLPIGISFYTFETITYVVDVYRKIHRPLSKFHDYLLYILFFPKLIAGPIVRYHELADQLIDRSMNETVDNRLVGFYRFVLGLGKKVLLANNIGFIADSVFGMNYIDIGSGTAWIGIIAYTFQIYFDFSGYSDMAIGIARMVGFRFPENFNNPYTSQSITEFWQRWHISLGNWMRNYLYIPLGGNRVSPQRLYFNLCLVFLLSGLWHGASWSFVFWGAYHGLFLVLERALLIKVYAGINRVVKTVLVFILIMIGWVFFRIDKLPDAFLYIEKLFAFDFKNTLPIDSEYFVYFLLAILFSFFTCFKLGEKVQKNVFTNDYTSYRHMVMAIVSISLLILSVSTITAFKFNPFIYFRF